MPSLCEPEERGPGSRKPCLRSPPQAPGPCSILGGETEAQTAGIEDREPGLLAGSRCRLRKIDDDENLPAAPTCRTGWYCGRYSNTKPSRRSGLTEISPAARSSVLTPARGRLRTSEGKVSGTHTIVSSSFRAKRKRRTLSNLITFGATYVSRRPAMTCSPRFHRSRSAGAEGDLKDRSTSETCYRTLARQIPRLHIEQVHKI